MATCIINIDGGSRGNPGPAAFGFVIQRPGLPELRGNGRLGHTTNNVAEYTGLIEALKQAQRLGERDLLIRSDSELLVKQMNGFYRVKHANLIPLFEQAKQLTQQFDQVRFVHVYREQNTVADQLCNDALDGILVEADATATEVQPPAPKLPSLKEALAAKTGSKRTSSKTKRAHLEQAIVEEMHKAAPALSNEAVSQLACTILERLSEMGVKLPASETTKN